MAANPSREVTRERERRAWELRQQFWTEQRIAGELGIDQATVSRMLKRVEDRLAKEFTTAAERIKAGHTAQLERIADEAYQAWVRSQLNAETSRTVTEELEVKTQEETLDDDGEPVKRKKILVPMIKTTRTGTSAGQAGDPRFLAEARGALSDIREIWGVDAPKKQEQKQVGPDGGPIVIKHEYDELKSMAPEELIRLHNTTIGDPETDR